MTDLVDADLKRLPIELQEKPQWCLAGFDKAPYLVGVNGVYNASPTKGPWHDFNTACHYATQYGMGVGFVLAETDPFTCIDIDIKDITSVDSAGQLLPVELLTTQAMAEFYSGVVDFAHSYTELSSSGKGLHIWVKGDIGAGRRGKGIEVYSRERFIICTGAPIGGVVYHNINGHTIPRLKCNTALPLADGTQVISMLENELGSNAQNFDLVEVEGTCTDEQIWARAVQALNAAKFVDLCNGDWKKHLFPSQSEADLALMSMFTFYSKSNEQCRRLFRCTALGSRAKATRDDVYLDRTLTIIRGRQAKDDAFLNQGKAIGEALLAQHRATPPPVDTGLPAPLTAQTPHGIDPRVTAYVSTMDQTVHAQPCDNKVDFDLPEVDGLDWPPGLVGAIAGFIYKSSPRPVKEVSIVAALGLVAGITGKAFNVGQTGINLYIILIARSAIGKEAMHSGIGHILRSSCGHALTPFVNFTDYASGPALTKAMEERSSFVNVSGEWGRKLQRMADDRKDGPMQQLRTVMTNLYQKSGAASVMGGLGYSNREQNVASVNAVAYSMIGETTPGTFYDSLTQTMMEDGFLSRFNIVEYLGERPPENKDQMTQVPQDLADAIGRLAAFAVSVVDSPVANAIPIGYAEGVEDLVNSFNLSCDGKIREAGSDESIRQIWNRAHLKVLRVCGVLAAADNFQTPVVTKEHLLWAQQMVLNDASGMLNKIKGGDVGADDTSRFKKLQGLLKEYAKGKISVGYNVHPHMLRDGIIPRSYLQRRTGQIRCFVSYRLGATLALDHTLKTAIDSGYILEIAKERGMELYNYSGRAFQILNVD